MAAAQSVGNWVKRAPAAIRSTDWESWVSSLNFPEPFPWPEYTLANQVQDKE